MVAGAGSPASTPAAAQRCRHRSTTTGVEMFSIVALHVAAADLKAPARGRFVWRWRAGCGAHHQARFHSGTILCADRENRTVHGVQGVGVRIIELESWRARRGRVFFFFLRESSGEVNCLWTNEHYWICGPCKRRREKKAAGCWTVTGP